MNEQRGAISQFSLIDNFDPGPGLKCLCHDLCNLFFVIIDIFYEEMRYIFKRKYSIFTGLPRLKVTGYDIKLGIAN